MTNEEYEHQCVSSEEEIGSIKGEEKELPSLTLDEDAAIGYTATEEEIEYEEAEEEMLEDEFEGEEEYALEDVPGFEEAALETFEAEEEALILEEWGEAPECGPEVYGAPESVCGHDDRVRILTTTRIPWRWSCQLLITTKNGRKSRCTGWLIGPRTVITSGHCLYSHSAGGWARSIEVIPGMNGTKKPFGSQVSRSFRSVVGWVRDKKEEYDYGAIILPEPCKFKQLGYFGFASLSTKTLKNLFVNNAGYAGDKPFGTLWYNAGRIRTVEPRRIKYMIDTYGGHSGSCVWMLKKVSGRWQRYAVGIHGYGGCPNKAVRIIKPVFDNMKRWKNEGKC